MLRSGLGNKTCSYDEELMGCYSTLSESLGKKPCYMVDDVVKSNGTETETDESTSETNKEQEKKAGDGEESAASEDSKPANAAEEEASAASKTEADVDSKPESEKEPEEEDKYKLTWTKRTLKAKKLTYGSRKSLSKKQLGAEKQVLQT